MFSHILTTLVTVTLVLAQIPPESRTIIDVLSQTGQFSVLLRHLQRHELIPFINTQRNITLAAPDNGAFAQFEGQVTKELLLYHILNGSATFENTTDGSHVFLTALDHVPVDVEVDHKRETMRVNKVDVVETDLEAGSQRGFVQVLEHVLALPSTWQKEIGKIPRLSHFSKLAKEAEIGNLSNMTLLAPTNDAMRVFTPLMDSYLTCRDGQSDLQHILDHFLIDGLVYGSRDGVYEEPREYTSRDGTVYSFSELLTVNKTWEPLVRNIPCQNGLIHVYDSLLSRDELLTFTPRMALQGLGLDRFVALLRLAGLGELIEGKGGKQTVFAPMEKPSAFEAFGERSEVNAEGEEGGEGEISKSRDFSRHLAHHRESSLSRDEQTVLLAALESDLSTSSSGLYSEGGAYHFTQSELILSRDMFKHKNHLLVDTKMKSKKIGYRSQRLKLSYDEVTDEFVINDRRIVKSPKYDTNLFIVGDSSIYLIDEEMEPPSGLASSVAPIFHTSRSLYYLNELGRLKLPLNYAGWTVFLPTTTAWDDLGITTEYLTSNKTALTVLFDSLIFHSPFYSDSKSEKLPTYDKSHNVSISWETEGHQDFVSVGGDKYIVNELEYDILFNSGVVHTVENVYIPHSLDVTVSNLIETTNSDFMELLQVANLSYTLDPSLGYSFLVPSEDSMVAENISVHSPDLADYMKLHVIQNNSLSSGGSASTLQSGVSLVAKKFSEKLLMVSIFQGIDREARILNRGIASNNATVFAIDRPLSPSWIIPDNPWFPSHDHLRTPVAIFIGIIIGLVAFFAILSCLLWVFLGKSREPDEEQRAQPVVVTKPKPKSRTDVLRQEAGVNTPLLAGGGGKTYATAPMSVNQPRKNGRGLKIGPQH